MKIIYLHNRAEVKVDDEDFKYLNQFKWHQYKSGHNIYAKRYIKIDNKYVSIMIHNEIMNPPENKEIDHINHNGLDNQKNNLRVCTHQENCMNRNKYKGASKYHGVSLSCSRYSRLNKKGELIHYTSKLRYVAQIRHNNNHTVLGFFDNEIEAAITYDKAAIKIFGEFANLNFKFMNDSHAKFEAIADIKSECNENDLYIIDCLENEENIIGILNY